MTSKITRQLAEIGDKIVYFEMSDYDLDSYLRFREITIRQNTCSEWITVNHEPEWSYPEHLGDISLVFDEEEDRIVSIPKISSWCAAQVLCCFDLKRLRWIQSQRRGKLCSATKHFCYRDVIREGTSYQESKVITVTAEF